jgi:hypothetical protein
MAIRAQGKTMKDFMDSIGVTIRSASRVGITVILLVASLPALADCEGLITSMNKRLNYPDLDTRAYVADCKVWPAHPDKTIVALAHFQEGSNFSLPPTSDEGLYDLDVLIVRTGTEEVLHRLLQKGALTSDAIGLREIAIDTARYTLAKETSAFGVRANRRNPHAEIQSISLYVVRGNALKQVMNKLMTLESFSENQALADCARSSDIRRTLAMAGTSSHGFADLIVKEKSTIAEPFAVKTGCDVKEEKFVRRYRLRFDGVAYVVPPELQDRD